MQPAMKSSGLFVPEASRRFEMLSAQRSGGMADSLSLSLSLSVSLSLSLSLSVSVSLSVSLS